MGPRCPRLSPFATPAVSSVPTSQLQVHAQSDVWTYKSCLPLHRRHQCRLQHGLHYFHVSPSPHFSHSVFPKKHDVAVDEQLLCTLCDTGHLLQAMALLSHIETPIHVSSYISLLKACSACKAPACARQVYSHVTQHSNEIAPSLGDYLAVVLSKCGAVDDASHIFHALSHRTVLSWTAMISALTDSGCPEEALQMFYFIQVDSVDPDSYTFVSLFKACSSINDLKQGKRLHALAHEKGFTSNVFVGNTLVSMYGKCGDMVAAEEVFNALLKRNIVSWNAMLSVFMEDGQADHALLLFRQMHEELMDPDQVSLVFALQACSSLAEKAKLMSMEVGWALHSLARTRCCESAMFVGTALISMYGKCGAIREAEHVFAALSQHDVVSWNAMLSAYIQQNQEEKALQLYIQMNKQYLNPDECTYVLVFQACGNFADKEGAFTVEGKLVCMKFLKIGQALHSDACRQGLSFNLAVGNSLVSMYGKHGAAMEAENVFSVMFERDTMSWSMMLSVYVNQSRGKKALKLYRQMQEEGASPDQHVLVLVLQACLALSQEQDALTAGGGSNKLIFIELGQALLVDAHKRGVHLDIYVGNALINLYSKCVGVTEAQDVFISLSERDVVAWTAMLSTYVEHGEVEKSLQLYKLMHKEQIPPNQLTFVIALHACGILMDIEKALPTTRKEKPTKLKALEIMQALHSDAHRGGFTTDALVRNCLVTLYGKCGNIVEAESLFNSSSHQDVATWNAMLSAYLECGQAEDALCLYKEMQKQHVLLDDVALTSLLHACSDTANLEMCRELHFYAASGGYVHNFSLATTLIRAYGSCASMEELKIVFDEVFRPDLVCWTACIAGNAGLENFVASADVFERSRLAGVKPDEVILSTFILDCSNRGFVIEGLEYCASTSKDFGVNLNLKHYGIMIDLLGRAGDFKRMNNILSRMPMQADLQIWLTLLGACQIHGNVELAKWAFENALFLEPMEASMYVIMSNICTGDGPDADTVEFDY